MHDLCEGNRLERNKYTKAGVVRPNVIHSSKQNHIKHEVVLRGFLSERLNIQRVRLRLIY